MSLSVVLPNRLVETEVINDPVCVSCCALFPGNLYIAVDHQGI